MSEKTGENKGRPYLLLMAAIIWGTGFVAQSAGSENVPTFTFSFMRNIVGAAVLVPVILIMKKAAVKRGTYVQRDGKTLLMGGFFCGLVLFIASNLQQYAFDLGSSAGNAGFITACYILIVPILGLFFKRKCGWNVWISVAAALVGLYFLCIDGEFVISREDMVLFACAFMFAVHILVIDHFSPLVNGVAMSSIQFLVCGILSGIGAFFTDAACQVPAAFEMFNLVFSTDAWLCILYAGAVSSGIGYTLQVVGQKNVNPTVASLLLSLESVFSVVFGWILLSEVMSARELIGCLIVFAAVIFSQLNINIRRTKN